MLDEGVILRSCALAQKHPCLRASGRGVVVTVLSSDYPLIRFGTGDLSATLPGPCPQGAPTRIRGWLGRADQTTKNPQHVCPPWASGRDRPALCSGAAPCAWWSAGKWRTTI